MPLTQKRLAFIEPAAPQLAAAPPEGDAWIHEIKFDGYRTEIILEAGVARAYTRSGLDWTGRYLPVTAAVERLKVSTAILDGEMIVADATGRSNFHELAKAIHRQPERIDFVAFDLLHLDGQDMRLLPLTHRRDMLKRLILGARSKRLVFSESMEGSGKDVFAAIEHLELEGMVSKRRDGTYRSGSRSGWLKVKCFMIEEFDVVGVARTKKENIPVVLVASEGEYRGQAIVGLDARTRNSFWRYVDINAAAIAPISGRPRKNVTWLKPGLTGKVKHLRGEPAGLRHASLVDVILPKRRSTQQEVDVDARPRPSSIRPAR